MKRTRGRGNGRWRRAAGFLAVVVVALILGEAANPVVARADDWAEADRELNAAYQQALRAVPGERQEQLRKAERAWIAFSNKNEAAFKTFAGNRGTGAGEVRAFTVGAIRDQRDVLRGFGQAPNGSRDAVLGALEAADAEMTVVYQAAIRAANPTEEKRLREAQRAWITWRDENARALYRADPRGEALLGSWRLTVNRARELRRFLPAGDGGGGGGGGGSLVEGPSSSSTISTRRDPGPAPRPAVAGAPLRPSLTPAPAPTPEPASNPVAGGGAAPPASESSAGGDVANTAADGREAEELDGEAAGLLRRALEEPAFGGPSANDATVLQPFSAVAGLPHELDEAAVAGLRRTEAAVERRRGNGTGGSSNVPAALGRSRAVFRALVAYGDAAASARGANAPAAARAVRAALDATPEPPPGSGGGPLWAGLRGLRDLCERGEREAAGPLTRAAGLEALNRPEEAVREYESAQRAFPDPAVAAKLRRLRTEGQRPLRE